MAKNPDWKDRYQACHAELERSEKQLLLLQKGVLRIALGYLGQLQELDDLLRLISGKVRNGERDATVDGSLAAILEYLIQLSRQTPPEKSAQIDNLSSQNNASSNTPVLDVKDFVDFLASISTELQMQAEMQVLLEQIKACQSDMQLKSLVQEAALFLSEYYKPSLHTSSRAGVSGQILIQLLEKISFHKDLLPRVNQIKASLNGNVDDALQTDSLDLVSDLLNRYAAINQSNADEFSGFLRKVTQRLESLHGYLDKSDLISSEHFSEAFSISQDLDDRFNDIRNGLVTSGSMSTLKANIENHLDFLNHSVADYVKTEKERMRQAEETLGALNSQLDILQDETETLKRSVEEEQAKSLTDALTSIANRRAYEERIVIEQHRWQRRGGSLSLMVFDLDKFKSINDNYGHVIGDKVLKGVTATFQREIRRTDFLARYGGEEFVLILPDTSLEETIVIADKLRHKVEDCLFRYKDERVPITISVGAAEFRSGDTGKTVFERADKALYIAKHAGRNTCRSEQDLVEAV